MSLLPRAYLLGREGGDLNASEGFAKERPGAGARELHKLALIAYGCPLAPAKHCAYA